MWPHTFLTSLCTIRVLYFLEQQYPKCCDWYFNDVLTPSLQILTQMKDSDQSFPNLKLVSLSVSTELMLRSCSGLSAPLMVWVVKADATCYRMTVAVIYHLYNAIVVCEASKEIQIPDLQRPQCCWWGSLGEVSNESLKWGEVVFVERMSLNVGKALRNIWLYKAHFDRPDSQPLRWV